MDGKSLMPLPVFVVLVMLQACASAQTRDSAVRPRGDPSAFVHSVKLDRIKADLLQPDGWMYFSDGIKSALLPDLNGTLISQTETELVLDVSDPKVPDVTWELLPIIRGSRLC
jgi:hypothetical protein